MTKDDVQSLMERYRKPAILAHTPLPAYDYLDARSHVGGLPLLPKGYPWPRSPSDNVPLHHMATIDLGAVPSGLGLLPDTGVLVFFARMDYEAVSNSWYLTDPLEYCRVLYFDNLREIEAMAPRNPPDDLPLFYDKDYEARKLLLRPGEPYPACYPSWPLAFFEVSSWPSGNAIPHEARPNVDLGLYQEERDVRWTRETERAVGADQVAPATEPWAPLAAVEPISNVKQVGASRQNALKLAAGNGQWLVLPETDVEFGPFPQSWLIVDRIARAIAADFRYELWLKENTRWIEGDAAREVALFAEDLPGADCWSDRAESEGLAAFVPEHDRRKFNQWLQDLFAGSTNRKQFHLKNAIEFGLEKASLTAATASKYASFFPRSYFRYTKKGYSNYGSHQMLGHFTSNNPLDIDRSDETLLKLKSDDFTAFRFVDGGDLVFRIDRKDLQTCRFEKVWAQLVP